MIFEDALSFVLKREGGLVNDADDPGGLTNQGVTDATYRRYRKEVGLPPRSVKEMAHTELGDIYRLYYWTPARCGYLPEPLDLVHFDTAVNMGVTSAAKLLQKTLRVTVDGRIGPKTLGAAATCDPNAAALAYLAYRADRYNEIVLRRPRSQKFLAGWMKRLDHLRQRIA